MNGSSMFLFQFGIGSSHFRKDSSSDVPPWKSVVLSLHLSHAKAQLANACLPMPSRGRKFLSQQLLKYY